MLDPTLRIKMFGGRTFLDLLDAGDGIYIPNSLDAGKGVKYPYTQGRYGPKQAGIEHMREELNEAIACTERDFARGVRSTVRVSAYTDGRKARNLKVYRGIGGLYVILGFRRKYPTMLKDMAGAHICRFGGKPVVVTYLECAHEQRTG